MDAIQFPRNPPPPKAPLTPLNSAKRAAAYLAISDHLSPHDTYVGIGSGSTIVFAVEAIASLPPSITAGMTFIPTGHQSRQLIIDAGLRLGAIDALPRLQDGRLRMLDVAFDGADEVDEDLNLIKGGGACLFQEKLVAVSARKFVCVADYRKLSPRLLTAYPTIPIEVLPLSAPSVLQKLRALGSPSPAIRLGGLAKAGPIVTDNSNFIIDAPFPPLLPSAPQIPDPSHQQWDVATLAQHIKAMLGVVEVGLFWGPNSGADGEGGWQKPIAAYFGKEDGEVVVKSAGLESKNTLTE